MVENYLRDQEIWHESIDVQEQPVEDILSQYDIIEEFTADEKEYLKSYLLRRAELMEFAEAARWASESEEPLLALIPNRRVPSQRLLELQHKAIMAEMEIILPSKGRTNIRLLGTAPEFKQISYFILPRWFSAFFLEYSLSSTPSGIAISSFSIMGKRIFSTGLTLAFSVISKISS